VNNQHLTSPTESRYSGQRYITSLWSEAKEDKVWDETPGFEIRLRGYGRIWGKAANEHAAWTMARKNLDNEGVLSAFQKMDKNDGISVNASGVRKGFKKASKGD